MLATRSVRLASCWTRVRCVSILSCHYPPQHIHTPVYIYAHPSIYIMHSPVYIYTHPSIHTQVYIYALPSMHTPVFACKCDVHAYVLSDLRRLSSRAPLPSDRVAAAGGDRVRRWDPLSGISHHLDRWVEDHRPHAPSLLRDPDWSGGRRARIVRARAGEDGIWQGGSGW